MDTISRFGLVIESMVWIRAKKKQNTDDCQFTVGNIHHTCYHHHQMLDSADMKAPSLLIRLTRWCHGVCAVSRVPEEGHIHATELDSPLDLGNP